MTDTTFEITPKIFLEPKEKRINNSSSSSITINKDMLLDQIGSKKEVDARVVTVNNQRVRCMARVATGNQCRRFQKDNSEFCGCHIKYVPHGKFGGPVEGKKFLNVPKKRGPRFRNAKEYNLDELDQNLYTQTQLVQIDDQMYLIDKHGIFYTNDAECKIIGRRQGDLITWFV